jgi:hypothetical protein
VHEYALRRPPGDAAFLPLRVEEVPPWVFFSRNRGKVVAMEKFGTRK